MNIFTEGINGDFSVGPDDADWLLRMVEEAHRPFVHRPYAGDIATEWRLRWQKSQAKIPAENSVASRYSVNAWAAAEALKVTYSGRGKTLPGPVRQEFPMETAAAAILNRWPGIALDQPEKDWNSQPHIAELQRMRMALQSQRDLPAAQRLHSGGHFATTWS